MAWLAGTAGSFTVQNPKGATFSILVTTNPAAAAVTLYSDAARSVSLGSSAVTQTATSTTYYLAATDHYYISVKNNGTEVANTPDGVRLFEATGDNALVFTPGLDDTSTAAIAAVSRPSVGERLRRAAAAAERAAALVGVPMATPPTVTTGTSNQDASLTSNIRYSVNGGGRWNLCGAISSYLTSAVYQAPYANNVTSSGNAANDSTKNNNQSAWEFMSDSPRVMLRILNNSLKWMVEVDGQPISATPQAFPAGSGTGYLLLDFTSGSVTITAATSTHTTSAAHGLVVGDPVIFGTITTTTGISANTVYYVSSTPTSTTFKVSATQNGTALVLTGDGSSTGVSKSATRRIRYESMQGTGFDGVYYHPAFSIWPPTSPTNLVVASVGDSIDAAATGVTMPDASWSKVAGKLLGWSNVVNVSLGGTGFTTAGAYGAGGKMSDTQRVTDAASITPDLLLITASSNDDSQSTLAAVALAAFQAYRTALPNTPIVVTGATAGGTGATTPSATRLATDNAVLSAFNSWADGNSWWIPNCQDTAGTWFFGTGNQGARAGSGNNDAYAFDTTHPTEGGHAYQARRWVQSFKTLVLPNIH